jgi:hypothetical protein
MTSISVAVKIWAKTVFLFGVFVGFAAMMDGDLFDILLAALAFFFGFIISLPLLLPIFSLVDISKRLLNYNIPARIAWLMFYLVLMFSFFYELVATISDNHLIGFDKTFVQFVFITTGTLLVAVLTTRKSLNKLYTGQ